MENNEDTYIFEDRSQTQLVNIYNNQNRRFEPVDIVPGVNLSGRDFSGSNLTYINFGGVNLNGATFSTDTIFRGTDFVNDNNDNENPANLENVIWPQWWNDVIYNDVILTPDQMSKLNETNPIEGININLSDFITRFATVPSQTREEQIESMRRATSNLPSLAKEVAKELEDKPDIGYGKCGICLEGFQLNDIVVDVHPSNNKPYDRHRFHKECLMNYCKNTNNPICPLCKDPKDPIKCENIKDAGKVIELKEGEQTGEVILRTLQGGKRKTARKLRKYIRKVKKTNKKLKKVKRRTTNKRRYRK